jgi:hypothetical protein
MSSVLYKWTGDRRVWFSTVDAYIGVTLTTWGALVNSSKLDYLDISPQTQNITSLKIKALD